MPANLKAHSEALAEYLSNKLSFLIPQRRNTYRQYLYVLALTAFALLARLAMAPLDGGIQYVTFFPVVAISAVIGGFWPGLASALISVTLATYLFWPPYQVFTFDFQRQTVLSNAVFLLDAVLVCASIEAMHRYYYRFVDMLEERKQMEAVLRNGQQDLNRAQKVAHIGSWRINIRSGELLWSEESHRIFGIPEGTPLTYNTLLTAVHPEDRAHVDRKWKAALLGEPYDIEHRILADGKVRWVRERGELEFDAQGTLLGGFGTVEDISEKRLAAAALAVREREFHTLADNIPDYILRCDLEGRVLYANRAMERLVGHQAAELLGKTCESSFPDGQFSAFGDAIRRVGAAGQSTDFEQVLVGPDGEPRHLSIRLVAELDSNGKPASVLAVGRDLTEQKKAEEDLRLAASVFHNSAEGVLVTNAVGTIVSVNPAFTEITGYTEDEALGRKPSLLRSDRHGPEFYRAMWKALSREACWQGEIWNRKKNGEAYLEWLSINRINNSEGKPIRYVSVFHDTTELWRKDERIRHLAFHDALTGLPNRALMQDRLQHSIERARREGRLLSVTFIDLDRFKIVNDTLGHDVGDQLLQEVATRIQSRLRAMDTVARLGGDEFVVLMEDLDEAGECATLAQELIREISRPMSIRGHAVEIGASMGIALFPEDGADHLELMKHSDMAMYAAKSAGRNTYHFFQQNMLPAPDE